MVYTQDIPPLLNHKICSTHEKRRRVKITTLNSIIKNNDRSTNELEHLSIRISTHFNGQVVLKYTRHLQHQKETGNISKESLKTDAISKQLDLIYGRAPDFILIFEDRHCLDGYPLWRIKYAEMRKGK